MANPATKRRSIQSFQCQAQRPSHGPASDQPPRAAIARPSAVASSNSMRCCGWWARSGWPVSVARRLPSSTGPMRTACTPALGRGGLKAAQSPTANTVGCDSERSCASTCTKPAASSASPDPACHGWGSAPVAHSNRSQSAAAASVKAVLVSTCTPALASAACAACTAPAARPGSSCWLCVSKRALKTRPGCWRRRVASTASSDSTPAAPPPTASTRHGLLAGSAARAGSSASQALCSPPSGRKASTLALRMAGGCNVEPTFSDSSV